MIPQGFQQIPTSTTYHHLPGSVRGFARQDNGKDEAVIEDLDPRDNFLAWKAGGGLRQCIISPEDSPSLSMLQRFQRLNPTFLDRSEIKLEKETVSATGEYLHIEVHAQLGETRAKLTVGQADGGFRDYQASGAPAETLFKQLHDEFSSQWNVSQVPRGRNE